MSVAYALPPEQLLPIVATLGEPEAQLYAYWLEICPGRGLLTARQHFDPDELRTRYPPLLQPLWLVDAQPNPLCFSWRLAGIAAPLSVPPARARPYVYHFLSPP